MASPMSARGPMLFLDFDGTITERDATDAILEAFANPTWLDVERAWLSGSIGSRECMRAQIDLVSASPPQVDALLDGIGLDPGFPMLLDASAALGVPLHIVSDGFDYCIRRILGRPDRRLSDRLAESQIVSSGLEPVRSDRWRATFSHPPDPCVHGCATCKPAIIERLRAGASLVVFVGDGMSDRHAAACADVVFAKDKLAGYCDDASIPYTPFDTLADVAGGVAQLMRDGLHRSVSRKAAPAL
jgi:2-hydroxy-3-keto-5-methylthiopentenyl-1-phosphate phosphatase